MKRLYLSPHLEMHLLHLERMISNSQTDQNVHTDDPQDPGGALVKSQRGYDVWDDDWGK